MVVVGVLPSGVAPDVRDAVVLARAAASLGEVTAQQLPRLATHPRTRVLVFPGATDLLAGHDESYIHAELVALADALLQIVPPDSVTVGGFPPMASRAAEVRALDGAARSVCELRGIGWAEYAELVRQLATRGRGEPQ